MKILVLSDSHSALSFMRLAIDRVHPEAVVHLGDFYEDGREMALEYPHIRFYQVAGNCDGYVMGPGMDQILSYPIGGVHFYMTHGHRHGVKSDLSRLLAAARTSGATMVLYGHTHREDLHREEDGLWVMNPGACGGYSGSVGLIEVENGTITGCYILRHPDLEEFL